MAFLFLLIVGGIAHGQATCSDASIAGFSSRGIKLGLTVNDVITIFATTDEERFRLRSGSRSTNDDIGYESFGASPIANEQFSGISHYGFQFLDGRLVSFSVNYLKPKWSSVMQFRDKLGESINLPKTDEWKAEFANRISTDCGNYTIKLWVTPDFRDTYSGLQISDNRVPLVLKERRSKIDEKQREKDLKVFKP